MKALQSLSQLQPLGKRLTRDEMKNLNGGGDKTIIWPGCSPKACWDWCFAQAGFGGECYNGQCACYG